MKKFDKISALMPLGVTCQYLISEYLSDNRHIERWLWIVNRAFMTPLYGQFCDFRVEHFKNTQKLQF